MKCFYHCDIDGRCAGSVVAKYCGNYNKEDFFEVNYEDPLPIDKIEKNEQVYLVDYAFSTYTVWQLDEILRKTKNVVWCDHHESSTNLLNTRTDLKRINGIVQQGISGAALTYMYLYKCKLDNLPMYIKYVNDYDCWTYKHDPYTTYFKLGMEIMDHDALDQIWCILHSRYEAKYYPEYDELDVILENGKVIKWYIDQDYEGYRDAWAYESEIDGHRCLVVNRKTNSWIFGEKYKEYPIVAVWVFDGEKYHYSLYSNNPDISCSQIAEKFGGGGHRGAAGFTTDELILKKVK